MAQVFTSYSRRDTDTVDTVVEDMSQSGIDVWIDRQDIKAGDNWRVQIVKAIKACPAFVLMLSPSSAASDNVRKEIDLSQNSKRPIFALMLEPFELPDEISYQLAGLQFIDVKKLGFENAVDLLIDTLKEHLAKLGPVEEPATRQAEIVIQGIDLKSFSADKQAQLLDFIAQLTSADRSQLQIANLAAGSVHVFVDLPADAAYEIVTRALNRDPRFKKLGIVSLRLNGDATFVNTASGAFTPTATAAASPLAVLWAKIPALFTPMLAVPVGKMLTVLLGAALIAGVGITAVRFGFRGASPAPTDTPTPFSTDTSAPSPATETPTATQLPTSTETTAPTETSTQLATQTPSLTATETLSPTPVFLILNAQVINRTPCYYGPGDLNIYQPRFGLAPTNRMQIRGQMEVWNGRVLETWLWGLPEFFPNECWINARNVKLDGEFSSLEMIYPEKVDLPFIRRPRWPAPQNVQVTRLGDQVMITWDFFEVPQGEGADSGPPYILETWICQDGQVLFYPIPVYKPSVFVTDQAGCAEPSHGRIILAEKHGYEGPLELKWPPYIVPQ